MPITTVYDTENQFGWTSKSTNYDEFDGLIFQGITYDSGLIVINFYENDVIYRTMFEDAGAGGGVFKWSDKTIEFDEYGFIQSEGTVFDNGVNQYDRYELGALVQVTLWDDANVESWSRIDRTYIDNVLEQQIIIYDDQIVMRSFYDLDGELTSWIKLDAGDLNSWTSYAQSFDQNGQLEVAQFYYDNGLTHTTTYSGGQRNVIYETDDLDVRNWDTRETFYGENNEKMAKVTKFDNGIEQAEEWENDNRSVTRLEDVQDAASWDSIQTYYDENGLRMAKVTTKDNGIVTEEEWDGSNRSVTRINDTQDVKAWDSIHTYYDQNGIRQAAVTTNDNGIIKTEEWEDGDRIMVRQEDTLDIKNWARIESYYEEGGEIAARETVMDSGDRIIFAYQRDGGQRNFRLDVDGDDSQTWTYRVTEYDDDGANPVVSTYDSISDLPEPYIDYLGLVSGY